MQQGYKPSQYNLWHKKGNDIYLYNVFSTGLLKLDNAMADKITRYFKEDENVVHLTDQEVALLEENDFIVPNEINELNKVKFRFRRGAYSSSAYITIVPTTGCNLACTYCFENNKTNDTMNDEDCQSLISFIENEIVKNQPPSYFILWYGGEPLLCQDIIAKVSNGVSNICQRLGIKREKDTIVTNGYLLDEATAKKMKEWNIETVQLTLDGNREQHNRTRIMADGGGTFDQVMEAILISARHFTKVHVRFNTNKDNISGVRNLILNNDALKAPNIECNIGRLKCYLGKGGRKQEDLGCYDGAEFQKIQSELLQLSANQSKQEINNAMLFYTKLNNCAADNYNGFYIGPRGRVFKCGERLDPGDEVGLLKNGKFMPNAKYWVWVANEPFGDEICDNCLYLPICMGGCPSTRRRLGPHSNEICGYNAEWLKIKLDSL